MHDLIELLEEAYVIFSIAFAARYDVALVMAKDTSGSRVKDICELFTAFNCDLLVTASDDMQGWDVHKRLA